MAESMFVDPSETVDLKIGIGDHWVRAKRELSYGESASLAGAMMGKVNAAGLSGKGEGDAEIGLDSKKFAIERLYAWLVDWSLTTKDGKTAKITRSAVENLRPSVAQAIGDALDKHMESLGNGETPPS